MKKKYSKPEFELTVFCFESILDDDDDDDDKIVMSHPEGQGQGLVGG